MSLRVCPGCGKRGALVSLSIVYPDVLRLEDGHPMKGAGALVCWPCGQMRRRGEPWQPIDQKRHAREWKIINRKNRQEDGRHAR